MTIKKNSIFIGKDEVHDIKINVAKNGIKTVAWIDGEDIPEELELKETDSKDFDNFTVKVKKLNFKEKSAMMKKVISNGPNDFENIQREKILGCVTGWDILDGDDKEVKLDAKILEKVDPEVVMTMFFAVDRVNSGIN